VKKKWDASSTFLGALAIPICTCALHANTQAAMREIKKKFLTHSWLLVSVWLLLMPLLAKVPLDGDLGRHFVAIC